MGAHFRGNGNRILEDAGLKALDLGHFSGLRLGAEVFVHNTDPAFLSHCNGQAALGDGIHCGGYEGDVDGDVAGQLCTQTDIARQNDGMGWHQKDVIERQGPLN